MFYALEEVIIEWLVEGFVTIMMEEDVGVKQDEKVMRWYLTNCFIYQLQLINRTRHTLVQIISKSLHKPLTQSKLLNYLHPRNSTL